MKRNNPHKEHSGKTRKRTCAVKDAEHVFGGTECGEPRLKGSAQCSKHVRHYDSPARFLANVPV